MSTTQQIQQALVQQLRLLNPAMSGSAGSPELLILETVANALSTNQVSVNSLSGTLDLSSKQGDGLDRFLALFGYARQTSAQATGFVTFSTTTSPTADIVIPANTQVYAQVNAPTSSNANTSSAGATVYFLTQFQGTIPAGSSPAQVTVPVIAQIGGSSGNVSAGTITNFGTAPVFGVTSVTNATATSGGTDAETDAELQTRFTNTVFRNLAGTEDQYLGLVASTQYSTQAQVIGPISRYQEYLQVPPVDDTQSYAFVTASGTTNYISGNATTSGNYTTALSTVPNSQYIYTNVPAFLTNGQQGAATTFYRQGVDWIMNTTPSTKNYGDAYRFWQAQLPGALNPVGTALPEATQPNVTCLNVTTSTDTGIDMLQPEQTILFEHAYVSTASRNNPTANVLNAVDIYVDGANDVTASTNLVLSASQPIFNGIPSSYLYNLNYQIDGEPGNNPPAGNYYFPLYQEPVDSLPSQITVNGLTASGIQSTSFFELGNQYELVQDITSLYGTVRCRNGISWNPSANGDLTLPGDGQGTPLNQYALGTTFTVAGYTYDNNIVTLQGMCESAKQITTDVLVHQAYERYFKIDITVVYAPGSTPSTVNGSIQAAVQNYFARLTFGALVQTGTILQLIFSVPGVQNVRYSVDLPFGPTATMHRVYEVDVNGNPLGAFTSPYVSPGYFDEDFYIGDDQLANMPTGTVIANYSGSGIPLTTQYITSSTPPEAVTLQNYVDTLPGLIIRARAESSWVRGPYNPALGPGNIPILPPD